MSKYNELVQYTETYTMHESALLQNIYEHTKQHVHGNQMLSGKTLAKLLQLLIQISNATTILELGTYTGYATVAMAEALPQNGKIISIDKSVPNAAIAKQFIATSKHCNKITLMTGDIKEILNSNPWPVNYFDFIFIDADKSNIPYYFEASLALLQQHGLIVIDNLFWQGKVFEKDSVKGQLLHDFNVNVATDKRVSSVLLPMLDGVNIVRKN